MNIVVNSHYRYFSVLKHLILIGLCEVAENVCMVIFGGGLTPSPLIQRPYYET